MTTQTENLANQVLVSIITSATETKAFLLDQIPDVLRQLIVYTIVWDSIILIICTCLTVGLLVLIRKTVALVVNDPAVAELRTTLYLVSTAVCCMFFVPVAVPVSFTTTRELVQVVVAPKIFLIEYAAKLVKGR
jgi:hypothetical protein